MTALADAPSSCSSVRWPVALLAFLPGLAALALSVERVLWEGSLLGLVGLGLGLGLLAVASRVLQEHRLRHRGAQLAAVWGAVRTPEGGEAWSLQVRCRPEEMLAVLQDAAGGRGRVDCNPAVGSLVLRTGGSLRTHGDEISLSVECLEPGLVRVCMVAAPVNLPSQASPGPLREQLTVLADAVHRAFGVAPPA